MFRLWRAHLKDTGLLLQTFSEKPDLLTLRPQLLLRPLVNCFHMRAYFLLILYFNHLLVDFGMRLAKIFDD